MAERVADRDDGRGVSAFGARLSGAIADAVAEVHVGAQAGNVVGRAAQAWGEIQHVIDAVFLITLSVNGFETGTHM